MHFVHGCIRFSTFSRPHYPHPRHSRTQSLLWFSFIRLFNQYTHLYHNYYYFYYYYQGGNVTHFFPHNLLLLLLCYSILLFIPAIEYGELILLNRISIKIHFSFTLCCSYSGFYLFIQKFICLYTCEYINECCLHLVAADFFRGKFICLFVFVFVVVDDCIVVLIELNVIITLFMKIQSKFW